MANRLQNATTRAKDIGGTAREVGGVLGTKARDLGGTIGEKAKDLGTVAAPRAREASKVLGRRTKETRRRVGYWIAGEEPKKRRSGLAVAAAGTGAAIAFFLDPTNGKRRRKTVIDWVGSRIRRVGARADGLRDRVVHLGDGDASWMNDPTLEQKVQSELFQGLDLPSKQISIMVANGVVSLRGTIDDPALIRRIEAAVRRIDGVRDVENQLRPGAAAPTT